MSGWYCGEQERRVPPPEFQEHIDSIGGLNRFGESNFLLVWGQTRTEIVYGQMEGGYRGAHTILTYGGVPSWAIMEWKPPETFGTAASWYRMTWDPVAEVHTLGEYPWRGLYIPCTFSLHVKRIEGGGLYYDERGEVVEKPSKMTIDAMPLAHWVIDLLVVSLRKSLEMTHAQKVRVIEQRDEAEAAAWRAKVVDAYMDAAPAWGGGASSQESNREAWMARLAEKHRGMKLSAEDVKRLHGIGSGHRQLNSGIRRK